MNLLSSDLFRNFGIGFVAGSLIVAVATIDQWSGNIETAARAAQPLEAPQASPEFQIAPLEVAQ
ncbi:hypothetical protein EH30_14395 [Erythrobacter sp. JL475]|nr:hypothetical protein EH30_14395 [Erythrobacter sp. JL475]